MSDELDMDSLANKFESPSESDDKDTIIKVIGVGGGGNNAVNHMYRQGIKNVSFVVCNTDRQALIHSPVPTQVQIGNGLGAGNKPEVAKEAAEKDIEKIEALFQDNTKMVFITAGMGGGTGTGASPVVARVAKERGLLTIGIVTIPFAFEGPRKIMKAIKGAQEVAKYVDALLVINNETLTDIYGDLDFINAFGKADDTLSTAASSISELITAQGYMNLDFHDVDTTLRGGGAAVISTGFGEGDHRVSKAIADALNSPLLKHRDIEGSKKLLFNIYFSRTAENQFVMSEAKELTDFVSQIDSDVDVIWGATFDDSLGEKVKITILAAGFDVTISNDDDDTNANSKSAQRLTTTINDNRKPAVQKPSEVELMRELYGDKIDDLRVNYIVLTPEQMDDDSVVEVLEKSPAYNRDRKTVENLRTKSTVTQRSYNDNSLNPGNVIDFD